MYNTMVKNIQGTNIKIRLSGGVFSYLFIFIALLYFIYPLIQKEKESNIVSSIKIAGLFGFILYGLYNATNYAIFSNYSINVAIKDTLWGIFVFFISTWITLSLLK